MTGNKRPFAVVTGASSGIGFELARCCVAHGYDLLIAADEPAIEEAAGKLRSAGANVEALQVDLATLQGVETGFFERADMLDTKVGTAKKQPARDVAKIGFDAMLRGDADVVAGWQNKLQAALSHVLPWAVLAELHRGMAAPGSAVKS
jgi:NAD(P)-dependent dehydrogenase (short-subunit alcohol dehydrogenase family)